MCTWMTEEGKVSDTDIVIGSLHLRPAAGTHPSIAMFIWTTVGARVGVAAGGDDTVLKVHRKATTQGMLGGTNQGREACLACR